MFILDADYALDPFVCCFFFLVGVVRLPGLDVLGLFWMGKGPGVVSLTRRVVLPTPRRSDSQGTAQFWAGALDAPFFRDFGGIFCRPEGHRDPRTHRVPGLLFGKGAFLLPPQARFHTHFSFPPQVFFLGGHRPDELQVASYVTSLHGGTNSKNCCENSPELSGGYREKTVPPKTPCFVRHCVCVFRGKCCPFLSRIFF